MDSVSVRVRESLVKRAVAEWPRLRVLVEEDVRRGVRDGSVSGAVDLVLREGLRALEKSRTKA